MTDQHLSADDQPSDTSVRADSSLRIDLSPTDHSNGAGPSNTADASIQPRRATDSSIAVTFFGVRGSTPASGQRTRRYGANTSCVGVEARGPGIDGDITLFLDFGTGACTLGRRALGRTPFRGACLLTHAHWDHIQGIPFFPPLLRRPTDELILYAPRSETGQTMAATLNAVMAPPMFPVGIDDLPGTISWVEVDEGEFEVGGVRVTARVVPHTGRALGYRLGVGDIAVTYIPDHQQPSPFRDQFEVADGVRELAADADLLIFDAQYCREEFAAKANWGHNTVEYSVWAANELGVKTLALFHHDPSHDDDKIDELLCRAQRESSRARVVAASEGQTLVVTAPRP